MDTSLPLRSLAGSAVGAVAAAVAAAVASAALLIPLFADRSSGECSALERAVEALPGVERTDGTSCRPQP